MATGIIKTKTDKGFGFIQIEGSDDVFFHNSACNGRFDVLQVGDRVTCDVEKGEKGLKATNVVAVAAADLGGETEAPAEQDNMIAA